MSDPAKAPFVGEEAGGLANASQAHDTMALLRASSSQKMTGSVRLRGYWERGDSGGGMLYWDPTSTADDNGGTVVKPDEIAPEDPGRWLRPDKGYIHVDEFGAKGGWPFIFDDLDAFNRAIAAATQNKVAGGAPFQGQYVQLGKKDYYLSDTLKIGSTIDLRGCGLENTRVMVAQNKIGILMGCIPEEDDPSITHGDSSGSFLRRFTLQSWTPGVGVRCWEPSHTYAVGETVVPRTFVRYGYAYECITAGDSDTTQPAFKTIAPNPLVYGPEETFTDGTVVWKLVLAPGIMFLTNNVTCENLRVYGSPGNNFHVVAGNTATPASNANRCVFLGCRAENAGCNGYYVAGLDANVCQFLQCDATGSFKVGFHTDAFLGAGLDTCHAYDNGICGYYSGSATHKGCYSEDPSPSVITRSAAWIGGTGGTTNDFPRTTWMPEMEYEEGDVVMPTDDNGFWYRCTVGGTSDTDEPVWPTAIVERHGSGPTTVWDGTVTWQTFCLGEWSGGLIMKAAGDVSPFKVRNSSAPHRSWFDVGTLNQGDYPFAFGVDGEPGFTVETILEYAQKRWFVLVGGGGGQRVNYITTTGHPRGGGFMQFPRGFIVGDGQEIFLRAVASAPPALASDVIGDLAFSTQLNTGRPCGWYRDTDGWVPFRLGPSYVFEVTGRDIPAENSSGTYINVPVAALTEHNLPTVAQRSGYKFTFVVVHDDSGNGFKIHATGGTKIRFGADLSSADGYIQSTTKGDVITLEAVGINPAIWVVTSVVGAGWSVG